MHTQAIHSDNNRCGVEGCIKAEDIAVLKKDVQDLNHAVHGNARPGLVENLSDLKEEFSNFVEFSKGEARARKAEADAQAKSDERWRWGLGILATLAIGLLLWLLSIILPGPLKEKGVISHDNETYSKQMISKE